MASSMITIQNTGISTLASALAVGATILSVISSSTFPPSGKFMVTVWNKAVYPNPSTDPGMEMIMVTAVNKNILTISKGQEGTIDSAHIAGSNVEALITPSMLAEISARINAPYNSVTVKANYSVLSSDYLILCDATAKAFTLTLPNATTVPGIGYSIKKIDSTKNIITIKPTSSQLIDNLVTASIASPKASINITCDGLSWEIQ